MALAPRQAEPDLRLAGETEDVPAVLRLAAKGDQEAWRRLIELYGRRVFALAKSRCGSAELADEISQSVFATLAMKLPSGGYVEQGKFEPWLFRIVINRVRDEIRRSRRQARPVDPVDLADRQEDEDVTPDEPPEGPGLADLRRAFGELSDADRQVVELRHHAGMAFRDIAELLGEPMGTVLARHHRALRKLRNILTPEPLDTEERGTGP